MHHYVARAPRGRLLFRTWQEGLRLYRVLGRAFPGMVALCVMPNHVHLLLAHGEGLSALRAVMSAFARWRAGHRDEVSGPVWERAPEPEPVSPDQEARVLRYVHLNPCRRGLVDDPLAWPLSTHRELVGVVPGTAMPHPRPAWLHQYVSSDPTVRVDGTPLPSTRFEDFDYLAIRDAVSEVTGTVIGAPLTPATRRLAAQAAAAHRLLEPGRLGAAGLAKFLDVTRGQVYEMTRGTPSRGQPMVNPLLGAVVRVVGDPRFGGLVPGALQTRPSWAFYRNFR